MESLPPTACGAEAFLEAAGVALGLWILAARLIDRRVGQAHHHPPDGSQHPRGGGVSHPALVLVQRDIQTMVEPALNDPVAALEQEHPLGLQLFEGQTAQKINHLAAPLALALDPCLQAGR